ncbi:AmmeMemoRadiSam system protein B [Bacteroidota bacterium]
MKKIRHSAIAGSWYPGTEKQLRKEINLMLDLTKPEEQIDDILGLISPHAGYRYSGLTAAYGYNLVQNKKYEKAIVLAPSHREYFPGVSIYSGDAYETPLGLVKINNELKERIIDSSEVIFQGDEGHNPEEHALEIQLPFLQVVLKDFEFVPMIIGDQRKEYVYEVGEKLGGLIDDKTLIVASTDLSHFHPKPEAEKLDLIVTEKIGNFDYDGLQEALESNKTEACGGGTVVALMKAADAAGFKHSKILHKTDSGEVTGDTSGVVGYVSAVFYK